MFVIVIQGGPFHGHNVDREGEVGSGILPIMEFEKLADAQDWLERNWERDDFGPGGKLKIEEI